MRNTFRPLLSLLLVAAFVAQGARTAYAWTVPVAASFSTAVPANRQSLIQLQGSDAEGTSLVYATTSTPSHGALSGLDSATGYVVYTPTAGYTGSDSFTYTVTSGGQTSAAGTVTVSVTNAKTTVTETLTDPSGSPRSGKVTFVLTQAVTTPAGLTPVGSSVSAALNSSGAFTVQLYPSRSMNPAAYYQVWFNDATALKQELLGVYDIPAAASTVSLSAYKVTDTNLAARYVFASAAGLEALATAAASGSYAFLIGAATDGKLQKYDAATGRFKDSLVSESGSTVTVAGGLNVTGTITGNCSGCTGITGGTGGVSNTGSTTVRGDSDNDAVGVIDLQVKDGVTGLRVENDATVSLPKGVTDATAPKLGVGAVNLAAKATAGDGSSGTPYTGWTAALSLSASDVAYYFPAKVYSFSTPLVFTGERVKIRCEPGAVLKFTGAGVAITSDGGAVTGDVNGFDIVGCKLVGNASATKGVYLRSSHRGYYDLEITDFTTYGLETAFAVGSDFRVKVSRHSSEPFNTTPVTGLYFGKRGAGEGTHAGNVWPVIEWVSGDGIVCNYCQSMVFHAGTSEGNGGRGRYFSADSVQNTIIGGDDEANDGDDLTVLGNYNKLVNFFSNKAGGAGIVRITGDYNTIDGGILDTVIIEATAAETQIVGGPSYNASGTGTITDSSTSTRWHSRFYNFTTGGYYFPNFDLTPAAGWAHAGGSWSNVGYYKRGDMVFLRGCAAGGSGTITTLPAGARPATDRGYSVRTGTTPTPGTVSVSSGGAVVFASGTNTLVCLDGISFELP